MVNLLPIPMPKWLGAQDHDSHDSCLINQASSRRSACRQLPGRTPRPIGGTAFTVAPNVTPEGPNQRPDGPNGSPDAPNQQTTKEPNGKPEGPSGSPEGPSETPEHPNEIPEATEWESGRCHKSNKREGQRTKWMRIVNCRKLKS